MAAITKEDCIQIIKSKVAEGNYRLIKAKLTEFGAKRLSNLDPSKYFSFYLYLKQI
jgi:hypothetical protein